MPASKRRSVSDRRLRDLLSEIRLCRICADELEPNPVFQISGGARIAIFGQAPGARAHRAGRPFDDPSGDRLRSWLGVDKAQFYDPENFLIAPMAFCFPGYDAKGGDRPPPKRCAAQWRQRLMAAAPKVELVLLVGAYAQKWHLGDEAGRTLTETVSRWAEFGPDYLPMPHPSWRNNAWLKKNPWFEKDLLAHLRRRTASALARAGD